MIDDKTPESADPTVASVLETYRASLEAAKALGVIHGLVDAATFVARAADNASAMGIPDNGRYGRILAMNLFEKAQTEHAKITDGSKELESQLNEAIRRLRAGT